MSGMAYHGRLSPLGKREFVLTSGSRVCGGSEVIPPWMGRWGKKEDGDSLSHSEKKNKIVKHQCLCCVIKHGRKKLVTSNGIFFVMINMLVCSWELK